MKALAPLLPLLDRSDFLRRRFSLPSPFAQGVWLANARAAILHILQTLKLGANDAVAVPSYHCLSMTVPIEMCGAQIVFFPVDAALRIDARCVAELPANTRALIAPHYFGFPQLSMPALRAACDARNIVLIEDCAHALFGQVGEHAFGTIGHTAVASVYKFFASGDGGVAVSNTASLALPASRPNSVKRNAKVLLNSTELARAWKRSSPFGWLAMARAATQRRAPPIAQSTIGETSRESLELAFQLPRALVGVNAARWTRRVVAGTDPTKLAQRRRENYAAIFYESRQWTGAIPLFGACPNDVVPYMFPLLLSAPRVQMPALRAAGVPFFCWEVMHPQLEQSNASALAMGRNYATSVVMLPVHQSLRAHEREAMCAAMTSVLGGA